MTIINAITFFESLLNKTNKKSEIKIYKDFITILSNLKYRELTEQQYHSIEKELKILDLKSQILLSDFLIILMIILFRVHS